MAVEGLGEPHPALGSRLVLAGLVAPPGRCVGRADPVPDRPAVGLGGETQLERLDLWARSRVASRRVSETSSSDICHSWELHAERVFLRDFATARHTGCALCRESLAMGLLKQ
ncbi:hypothetical protein GCM10012276_34100 [Nocardioides deserti]|nr:hypothetical protein GCM10012276_34100 [Nocardioides deserti]